MNTSEYCNEPHARWEKVELRSCFELQNGVNFSSEQRGEGLLVLDVLNMFSDDLYVRTDQLYRVDIKVTEDRLLRPGDILFVRSSVKESGVGWPAIFKGHEEPVTNCGFLIRARQTSPKLEPRFLVHYLRQNHVRAQMISRAGKVAITNINQERLGSLKIPLPPIEEQKRIADILDHAEALRAKRRTALAQLDELVQSTFIEMFGDPVINPMNWDTKKLEKLCVKIFGGGTPSKSKPEYYEGNIPWVTPKDMKRDFIQDSIDHISAKAIEESSTKLIPQNSLLMVIRSGILKKKLPVAMNMCEVTMNQDMKSFLFDNKLTNSYFMLYFFKIYQRDLLNRVRSVTADNLEFNQIKEINVIVPPIEKQQKFTKIVEHVERVRSSQKQSALEINNLFDALMHKAFNGKLFSHQSFERQMGNGGYL